MICTIGLAALPRLLPALMLLLLAATPSQAADVYLVARAFTKTLPDSTAVPMWGFAKDADNNLGTVGAEQPTVPGPTITVLPGDPTLNVHVRNELPDAISIVIPGQNAVLTPVREGGRIRSFTHETAPAGTGTYMFTNVQPGSYLYHSGTHPAVQVQMGLYGAVKKDAAAGQAYPGVLYDSEVILFYSEIDTGLHAAVDNGTYGTSPYTSTIDYEPSYFLVNGDPFYPARPPFAAGNPNDRVLIRFYNAGLRTHVPQLLAAYMDVIAEDGNPYPFPKEQYSVLLPAGKTADTIWTLNSTPVGVYSVYDRALDLHDAGQTGGGLLAKLEVTATPPPSPVSLFCYNFNSGLAGWTETGEGDWNTEPLHATTNYPGTGSGSPAAHSDNCDSTCTITLAAAVSLQNYTSAQLNLLRFVDNTLDAGEYLRLQAWNGTTWQTLADWSANNGSDTNQWHAHSIDLAAYLGQTDFRIRFVTSESSSDEHVHVDDVCLTALPSGGSTTTTTVTTTTLPSTTTTTLVGPTTLFCDTFASLGGWTETGEGDWNTESLHATTNYPGTGSGSPAAHSDNCDATCTLTQAAALNLTGYTGAQLNLLRFVDSELDAGEYLRLEAWNGSAWQTLAEWSEDTGTDTNQWHAHTFNLAAFLSQNNFRIRFVTHESSDTEHVHVDDVCITGTNGGSTTTTTLATTTTTAPSTTTTAPSTTTTTPTTTTTTLVGPTAQVVADARTEASNSSSNFGSSSVLSADNDSEKNTFIRIVVSGTGGVVNSAQLRLTVPNIDRADSDTGGRVRPIACNTWAENTLTFNNQPAITGTPGPAQGPVTQGQLVTFNLAGIITGDGTFCVVITSDSSNGVDYNSREAATNKPVVIVN